MILSKTVAKSTGNLCLATFIFQTEFQAFSGVTSARAVVFLSRKTIKAAKHLLCFRLG